MTKAGEIDPGGVISGPAARLPRIQLTPSVLEMATIVDAAAGASLPQTLARWGVVHARFDWWYESGEALMARITPHADAEHLLLETVRAPLAIGLAGR